MLDTRDEIRGALRMVPYMGVIAVVAEAEKLGFTNGDPDWINLGQGQPEVGELEGAPPRPTEFRLEPIDHAYGPVHGTMELRQAVADHYNRIYRRDRDSKYTANNVAIAAGGRLALSRAVFALAPKKIGYQVPDYSAYQDMLGGQMPRVEPIPVFAAEDEGFALSAAAFESAVDEHGLGSFLISNPCNPTGGVIRDDELASWVDISRRKNCALLCDEFYSHFIYTADGEPASGPVSAASEIEDVNADPVLIFDGLTKSFRYPGWRVGWVVGPEELIECFITAGSSIDGGPARVIQRAAVDVLEPARADQETGALRRAFARKRNLMLERLEGMGVRFPRASEGTFYLWGCLDRLEPPFEDAETFFHAALLEKVLTVPGYYFDIDPGRRRSSGAFDQWMRFSFGPPHDAVEAGLSRLEKMLGR